MDWWSMRLIIQRVRSASVVVDGATVAEIGPGLLCLLGFHRQDTVEGSTADIQWLAKKVLACRLFPGADGKPWGSSAASEKHHILLVSQFTLHGNLRKPKPDYSHSAKTDAARALWDAAVSEFRGLHGEDRVHTGVFGAEMLVNLSNWGPVTFSLDTANKKEAYAEDGGGEGGQHAEGIAAGGGGGEA